jgi:hypothetical protein
VGLFCVSFLNLRPSEPAWSEEACFKRWGIGSVTSSGLTERESVCVCVCVNVFVCVCVHFYLIILLSALGVDRTADSVEI